MTQALDILGQLLTISLVHTSIALIPPYLLAVIGEIYSEQSGMLNIGVEGIMVLGAFLGFYGQFVTDSAVLGFLLAAVGGASLALLMAYLTVTLKLEQIVVGLGIFFVGFGLASYLSAVLFPEGVPPRIETLQAIEIPILSTLPVIGDLLFTHNAVVYLTVLAVPVSYYVLFRTKIGREIRAAGEDPSVADSLGVDVFTLRYACLIIGGILAALAGAYLTQGVSGRFTRLIVGGKGFIVLGLVIVSLWDPRKALGVVLLVSVLESVQFRLQNVLPDAPIQILAMLPFIATILILLAIRIYGGIGQEMPAALTVNYERGKS
jgi:simple sugar transport system permease protein